MMTFQEFRQRVMAKAFPTGEPEHLVSLHRDDLVAGLMDIQTYIPFFRSKNTSVANFCSTYFWCGATVIDAPRGRIMRVYTLPAAGDCCAVYYEPEPNFDTFINWLGGTRPNWVTPSMIGKPSLSMAFKYADASTDKGIRYNFGTFCLNNGKLFIGQRIESTERVLVDWTGTKRKYEEADLINFNGDFEADVSNPDEGLELIEAMALWVKSKHFSLYEEDGKTGKEYAIQYGAIRAEMCFRIKMELRQNTNLRRRYNQLDVEGCNSLIPTCTVHAECEVTPEAEAEAPTIFVITGDFDGATAGGQALATLIDSIGPDYIVSQGDTWNNDTAGNTADELDLTTGQYFRRFLHPYLGTRGAQVANEQMFFTGIGNHDEVPTGRFDIFKEYFNLPPIMKSGVLTNNEGYYDLRKGDIHFFFIDSANTADGVSQTSKQGIWITSRIKASNARWKIALIHYPPYVSIQTNPVPTTIRWDYASLGLDFVVSGHRHVYERLEKDGLPYFVMGLGGHARAAFETTDQYSVVRYNDLEGTLKVTATCAEMQIDFVNTAGAVIDSLTIEK